MAQVDSFYIGDDWIIPLTVSDSAGNPLNLAEFAILVTYYPPAGSTGDPVDVTSGSSIAESDVGSITIVVPRAVTGTIPKLPQGRKNNLAHVQVSTVDTALGYRVTRKVISIEPVDPASFDPRPAPGDGPNYVRTSIFPFGTFC